MKLEELLKVNSEGKIEIILNDVHQIYYGKKLGEEYREMLKKIGKYEVKSLCPMYDDFGISIYIEIKEK